MVFGKKKIYPKHRLIEGQLVGVCSRRCEYRRHEVDRHRDDYECLISGQDVTCANDIICLVWLTRYLESVVGEVERLEP